MAISKPKKRQFKTVELYYLRSQHDYQDWTAYVWDIDQGALDDSMSCDWNHSLPFKLYKKTASKLVIKVKDNTKSFGIVLHKGDVKNHEKDLTFNPKGLHRHIWVIENDDHLFHSEQEARSALANCERIKSPTF